MRDWLADQSGAWVMALFPALAGLIVGSSQAGRIALDGIWLFVCWTLCYCMEFTAARWLKSRGARRYLPPVIGYGAALALVGVPFVALHPAILVWAPVFALLAALEFAAAWLRRERTLWGNAVAVAAASLMAAVVYDYSAQTTPAWLPSATGLSLCAVFAVVEFGSVLFVKTMIRERGNRRYLAASWLWHIALPVCVAIWQPTHGWPWLLAAAMALLVRALAMPLIARHRRIKPLVTGAVEAVANIMAFIGVLLAWL